MCLESAHPDLLQKPKQHVIPMNGDDNYYSQRERRAGIDSPAAGVPHSHLLQRWKLRQHCNLLLSLLPNEQHSLRDDYIVVAARLWHIEKRVQWDTSSEGL